MRNEGKFTKNYFYCCSFKETTLSSECKEIHSFSQKQNELQMKMKNFQEKKNIYENQRTNGLLLCSLKQGKKQNANEKLCSIEEEKLMI
jgi:hypothetical protein